MSTQPAAQAQTVNESTICSCESPTNHGAKLIGSNLHKNEPLQWALMGPSQRCAHAQEEAGTGQQQHHQQHLPQDYHEQPEAVQHIQGPSLVPHVHVLWQAFVVLSPCGLVVQYPQVTLQARPCQQSGQQEQTPHNQFVHVLPQGHAGTEQILTAQAGSNHLGDHQQPAMEAEVDMPTQLDTYDLPSETRTDAVDMAMKSLASDEVKCKFESLRGSMERFAFDKRGCRVAQDAFEVVGKEMTAELVSELEGGVCRALRSPYANYVIEKAIKLLPPAACGFIVQEMRDERLSLARHRSGCRVFCRLLEFMGHTPACVELFDGLLNDAAQLCRHKFGRHVMQSVLEHGQPQQRSRIVMVLKLEWSTLTNCANGSRIIQEALRHGSVEEQQQICKEFLKMKPAGKVTLATQQHGCYVMIAMLRSRCDAALIVAQQLREAGAQLLCSESGKHVHKVVQQVLGCSKR